MVTKLKCISVPILNVLKTCGDDYCSFNPVPVPVILGLGAFLGRSGRIWGEKFSLTHGGKFRGSSLTTTPNNLRFEIHKFSHHSRCIGEACQSLTEISFAHKSASV